jgi:hypothetical protein
LKVLKSAVFKGDITDSASPPNNELQERDSTGKILLAAYPPRLLLFLLTSKVFLLLAGKKLGSVKRPV